MTNNIKPIILITPANWALTDVNCRKRINLITNAINVVLCNTAIPYNKHKLQFHTTYTSNFMLRRAIVDKCLRMLLKVYCKYYQSRTGAIHPICPLLNFTSYTEVSFTSCKQFQNDNNESNLAPSVMNDTAKGGLT